MIDPISDRDKELYDIVNFVSITGVISLFGVATNIINIIVFFKQGFNNTINISLFALATSDLCSLISMLWYGVCENPLFVNADINIYPLDVLYLTAGMPHICFARITSWITVFIAAERSLCITFPLKIKQIITPKRTLIIIIGIYIGIFASFGPEYATSYFDWKFIKSRNKTLLGMAFTSDRKNVEGLVFFLYSILGFGSFVAVITFTMILVVQLNRQSKWRLKGSIDRRQAESISNRDRTTMSMVVMIATVLIVCYTPGVAVSMVTVFEPDFYIFSNCINIFLVCWSFVVIFETLNSSINIFFYYHMSIKYRETFRQVFGIKSETRETNK